MQKCVADIRAEIEAMPARSAWSKGVCEYAKELFDDYVDRNHLPDTAQIGKVTKQDLLNGADNWMQYSYGGCSLVYEGDICERLCSPSGRRKYNDGARQPGSSETWLDWQARALEQAARIIIRITNRRY